MGTIAGGSGAGDGTRKPRNLWIVGALGAVWSGYGCWRFALTSWRDTATMRRLAPDVIDFIDAYPAWVILAEAGAVGFALLGSLLLLGRSRWAAPAFAASLAGLGANQFYQLATGLPPSWNTWAYWAANLAGWLIGAALLTYAMRLGRRGILT
jgi:hypothetical protein